MSYHLCTGEEVPAAYNHSLTEKCDSENNAFDELVFNFYFFTFLVFGIMVMYANIKKRKQDTTSKKGHRSFHILVNNKLFFWRMTLCITAYQVCSKLNLLIHNWHIWLIIGKKLFWVELCPCTCPISIAGKNANKNCDHTCDPLGLLEVQQLQYRRANIISWLPSGLLLSLWHYSMAHTGAIHYNSRPWTTQKSLEKEIGKLEGMAERVMFWFTQAGD